jgi:hypothetical protein
MRQWLGGKPTATPSRRSDIDGTGDPIPRLHESKTAPMMGVGQGLPSRRAKALDMISKAEGGFLDRDLYPFCANVSDGKIYPFPNPNAKATFGTDARNLKDPTGKEFGKELFAAGQKPEGQITEVSYMFSKPSDPNPVPKVSFVASAGDIYCGVGYYK